jgi:release factor glutamine methyltransferase
MPTNREVFFALQKQSDKYLTRPVIKALLNDANGFSDLMSLYQNFDLECPKYEQLMNNVERVKNGEPFQYVLGYSNFIDLEMNVTPSVLIPRPETEELVVRLKSMIDSYFENKNISIADIGTGSGAIAVSLKHFFPDATVTAVDISHEAIEVAVSNAEKYHQSIAFFEGNMVDPIVKLGIKLDVLVSNPPYIPSKDTIDDNVWNNEPHLALLANPSTKYYEEIFSHAAEIMNPHSIMAFEIGEDMEQPLKELMCKYLNFTNLVFKFSKDMYNKTRFLYIIMSEEEN